MAQLTHLFKHDAVERSSAFTDGTTLLEVTDRTINWADLTGAGFADGDVVHIIWAWDGYGSHTTNNAQFNMRIGTTFAGGTNQFATNARVESMDTSTLNGGVHMGWHTQHTLATNQNIYFGQLMMVGGSARSHNFSCFVFRRDDLAGTDLRYGTGFGGFTTTTSYQTDAVVTLPASSTGEKWIVFGAGRFDAGGVTRYIQHQLSISGGVGGVMAASREPEDSAEELALMSIAYIDSSTASQTIDFQAKHNTGTAHVLDSSRILAIRLGAFESAVGAMTGSGGATALSTSLDTYTQIQTVSLSLTTTGPVVVYGQAMIDEAAAGATSDPYLRIQENNTDIITNMGRATDHTRDPADIIGIYVGTYASSMTSGTKTIDMDVARDETAQTGVNAVAWTLVAFSMELAPPGPISAAGTITATGAVIATAASKALEIANGVSFSSAQHRFRQVTPQAVFGQTPFAVGVTTAVGTITFSAQMPQAQGTSRAFGTITVIGAVIATAASKVFGTSTATGDLVADGASNVFAVTTFIGELIAGGGSSFAFGTATFRGNLSAIGGLTIGVLTASTIPIITRQPEVTAARQAVLHAGVLSQITLATATITFRGNLAAIPLAIGANAESQSGISLSSAQHRYYNRTAPSFVSSPIIEDGATTATGTITASAQVAASGTQLARGTSTFSGQLAANGINLNAEIPTNGAIFSIGLPFPSRNQRTLNVGLVTIASPIVRAFGRINFAASLAATSDSGVKFPVGTITVIGTLSSSTGNVQVSATISIIGTLRALSGDVISVVAGSTSVFTDELPAPSAYVWLHRGPPPSLTARGTISFIGSLSATSAKRFTFATVTMIGAVEVSTKSRAFATSTFSGDLVAAGSQGVIRVSGTITFFGAVISVSGNVQPKATITVTSALVALGTNPSAIVVPTATITATATLFGKGKSFCPIKASGTITVSLSLSATENPADDKILAKGRIQPFGGIQNLQFSGFNDGGFDYLVDPTTTFPDDIDGQSLVNVTQNREGRISAAVGNAVFWNSPSGWEDGDAYEIYELIASPSLRAAGTISGNGAGTFYAYATITFAGQLPQAKLAKVSCIRPMASITMTGGVISAQGGDLNLKRSFATITATATLGVSAIYARESAITFKGSLTAIGRNAPFGTASMLAGPADFNTVGQIGPGTIDGQKKAIIRTAYGSIELYNNSQGGFYSVGGGAAIKEVFGLINVTASLTARGQKDDTKFAAGGTAPIFFLYANGRSRVTDTIRMTGSLQAVGNVRTVGVGTVLFSGNLQSSGARVGQALGTITASGSLSAIGARNFSPTYNGSQSPSLVGDAYADYQDLETGYSGATSYCQLVLQNITNDCTLRTSGTEGGLIDDQGSYADVAGTTVFNLNTRPDNVKIRLVSAVSANDRGTSGSGPLGMFTSNLPFDATNGVNYGYAGSSEAYVFNLLFLKPTITTTGEVTVTIEFTFTKSGYNDLTVTYKIRSRAKAAARSF